MDRVIVHPSERAMLQQETRRRIAAQDVAHASSWRGLRSGGYQRRARATADV
jgi:hypothetical protein